MMGVIEYICNFTVIRLFVLILHARFIQRFGTHVIVGVSMGGKDVLYLRQEDTSYLGPTSIQKLLKDTANMKFKDSADNHCLASEDLCNQKEVSLHFFIDSLLSFCKFCWKKKIIIIKSVLREYFIYWLILRQDL